MQAISFDLNLRHADGYLDRVEVDPAGLIRVIGWFRGDICCAPEVSFDGNKVSLLHHYRSPRPDVHAADATIRIRHPGAVFEYLVHQSMVGRAFAQLSITFSNRIERRFKGSFTFLFPDYRDLLDSTTVYHREHIYGSGPPNPSVHPEVLALATSLRGPVLDFGCGSGALIAELQTLGIEVRGLELDIEKIRKAINPSVAPAITLYDGTLPLNLPDGAFTSVFCSEVLEHIPDYHAAVKEIARLASEQAIFTVPDMSTIPLGFRHSLVPWHLLESTHVNFFNQSSLLATLKPFFSRVEFSRIGGCPMNDSRFFTSLVAFCTK